MAAESVDLWCLPKYYVNAMCLQGQFPNDFIRSLKVSEANILQNLCHYCFSSVLISSFVATLSLSAPLSAGLFSKCGGHFPPFEDRGKSLETQSTLPEFAVLEPAVQGLEVGYPSARKVLGALTDLWH